MIARKTIGLPERARACQGDREGRPYNTRGRVTRATGYCTGDPRGRPGPWQSKHHFTKWSI